MKRTLICLFALALFCGLAAAQGGWVYLGKAHVDGQHDHDDIKVGRSDGRFHFLQLRVVNAPIEFDRIVVHYGNGQAETLHVPDVIGPGGHTRAIPLQGDRFVAELRIVVRQSKSKLEQTRSHSFR
jgi:hypothetical protein